MDAISWAECWKLVLDLWPRWKPNQVQVDLWRESLEGKAKPVVWRAIRKAASVGYSQVPRLAIVLSSIPSQPRVQKREPITPAEERQIRREGAEMLAELKALPPASLAAVVAHARKRCEKFLSMPSEDPATWPRLTVGLVWAAIADLELAGAGS